MAQHNVTELLTTDGNPVYAEVANRDSNGNQISTTYGALSTSNTWTEANTFNGNVTFDGTVHSDLSFDSATGFTIGGDNTGYFGTSLKVNGNVLTLPSTVGTIALQSDVSNYVKANPGGGSTPLTSITVGGTTYTIPQGGGGSGDATLAGNNTWTGTNTFNGAVELQNGFTFDGNNGISMDDIEGSDQVEIFSSYGLAVSTEDMNIVLGDSHAKTKEGYVLYKFEDADGGTVATREWVGTQTGTLGNLATSAKDNLVNAVNEVNGKVTQVTANPGGSGTTLTTIGIGGTTYSIPSGGGTPQLKTLFGQSLEGSGDIRILECSLDTTFLLGSGISLLNYDITGLVLESSNVLIGSATLKRNGIIIDLNGMVTTSGTVYGLMNGPITGEPPVFVFGNEYLPTTGNGTGYLALTSEADGRPVKANPKEPSTAGTLTSVRIDGLVYDLPGSSNDATKLYRHTVSVTGSSLGTYTFSIISNSETKITNSTTELRAAINSAVRACLVTTNGTYTAILMCEATSSEFSWVAVNNATHELHEYSITWSQVTSFNDSVSAL